MHKNTKQDRLKTGFSVLSSPFSRRKYLLFLAFSFSLGLFAQSQDKNYVFSTVCLDADCVKRTETIQYLDGLGRPDQTLDVGASPSGKDVVTHIEYDALGRQTRDYLPVPQNGASTRNYYDNPLSSASSPDIYGGETIYAEKVIENSPLGRLQQQTQPGTDWQSHPVKYDYRINTANDILRFTTVTGIQNGANYTQALKIEGYYPAKQLYKNRVSDEDGNKTYEFKNTQGQTLLIRKVLGDDGNTNQGLGPQPTTQYADTYYVYNEYNQLALVITPLACSELKQDPHQIISDPSENTLINNLCYQYRYDGRGRLVEKKLPGKGWEYMVYDLQDRLTMTQDANLGATGQWAFTKYDPFGRPAYSGLCSSEIPMRGTLSRMPDAGRQAQQNAINAYGGNNVLRTDIYGTTELSGLRLYYTTNDSFPSASAITQLLSVNYYDTYPTGNDNASQSGTALPDRPEDILEQPTLSDDAQSNKTSTKGLPTASYVKITGEDNSWSKTLLWYDELGRSTGTHTINHLGGSTVSYSVLDFAGVVQHSETWHNKIKRELPIHIIEDFVYDHRNRLVKHYHEVEDRTSKVLLTENHYNEKDQLDRKKVGSGSDENFTVVSPALQEISYSYNIRSWMTGINLNPAGNTDNTKLFSYKIRYNDPLNTNLKKYNGNIAEIDWSYQDEDTQRYEYNYDNLNRLQKADYKSIGQTTTTDSKFYNEQLSYDLNGNILSLKRNARPNTGQTAVLVDDLVYEYEDNNLSNRLSMVYDDSGNLSGYPAVPLPGAMTYDDNGNMLTMPDKGITDDIVYNHLNLPEQVTQNGNPVTYTYRADGVKVHKNFNFNGTDIDTEYLDGFVYTTPYTEDLEMGLLNNPHAALAGQQEAFELAERTIPGGPGNPIQTRSSPNFFPTAEGFYDYENSRYIYQYKDHLGNVRFSYTANPDDGSAEEVSRNDYYPFGLNFINISLSHTGHTVYNPSVSFENYKYNGKELEETGMYDYGARFYMPDIGRWGTIDPRSQYTHEAYSYVWNNPTRNFDPTGMEGEESSSGGGGETGEGGGLDGLGNAFATCPTCPNTPQFQPFINDPNNTYVYDPKTNTAEKETQIEEVVITKYTPIKNNSAGLSLASMAISVSSISLGDIIGSMALPSSPASIGSFITNVLTKSLWALPLILNGDSQKPDDTFIPPPPLLKSGKDDDIDTNGIPVPGSATVKPIDGNTDSPLQVLEAKKPSDYGQEAEHTRGARPSTKTKHEKGQSRKGRDKGGEKGDARRTRYK